MPVSQEKHPVLVYFHGGGGEAYREMEAVTGQHWDKLYIAGGGAKNATLNELTAHYTGKQVVALPIEATAIGNLKIQMNIH